MANWFIDTSLATGSNDGTSTDDAWQSIETGFEYGSFSAGDMIYVRRTSNFSGATSHISVDSSGTLASPLIFTGWPRNTSTGTADFVNGSRVIQNTSVTPDFERHAARMIKNDTDGKNYLITAVAHKIDYDNETGTFTEGLYVTGGTSGAVGKIMYIDDQGTTGSIWVVLRGTTTFQNDEQITDSDTGVADVNGASADDGYVIDRLYAGSTASTSNYTIEADDHYTEAQAIDDSLWTIKLSTWDSDNDDLPVIDLQSTAYSLYVLAGSKYVSFKCLNVKNSNYSQGTMWMREVVAFLVKNCIIEQGESRQCMTIYDEYTEGTVQECVFRGDSGGSGQVGIYAFDGSSAIIKDVAIYNMGDVGLRIRGTVQLENVNIGIELGNDDADIDWLTGYFFGIDVDLDGENGLIDKSIYLGSQVKGKIYNYGKVLDAYREFYVNGEKSKVDVVAGSGDPQKRTGGADSVIGVECDRGSTYASGFKEWDYVIEEFKIWADTSSKSYRFYVQCDAVSTTSSELYLECKCLCTHDSSTEYQYDVTESDESCSTRSSASDWSQYIEVTGIQPAAEGWIFLKIKLAKYDSDGTIYIDPQVVVS